MIGGTCGVNSRLEVQVTPGLIVILVRKVEHAAANEVHLQGRQQLNASEDKVLSLGEIKVSGSGAKVYFLQSFGIIV